MTTTHNHPHHSRRPPTGGRPGTAVPDVAGELRRLMPRDRYLIDLLHHHHVLSTEQIAALAFDNVRTRLSLALLPTGTATNSRAA